nr:hypothetical protein JBOKJLJH_00165 [Enterobacter asburiae]
MYNGIVVRASSLVVITDEGLLRLIDSDCTHWAKGNKMTASRITHLIRGPLGKRKLSYAKRIFCTDGYRLNVTCES